MRLLYGALCQASVLFQSLILKREQEFLSEEQRKLEQAVSVVLDIIDFLIIYFG